MSELQTATPADTVGLRGVRARWLADTLDRGLVRPSAAWFQLGRETMSLVSATLAASVYLAWGIRGRARLEAATDPLDVLASDPGLAPSLLWFADRPTDREERHQYLWSAGQLVGPTAPYVKVERAARTVLFGLPPRLALLQPDDLPEVRREVARRLSDLGERVSDGPTQLERRAAVTGTRGRPTRLGVLCEVVGGQLGAQLGLVEELARVRSSA